MEKREIIYRHSGTVRITHWINVLVLLVLLMSGMQIFNAHPALYLGPQSNFDAPIFAMACRERRSRGNCQRPILASPPTAVPGQGSGRPSLSRPALRQAR